MTVNIMPPKIASFVNEHFDSPSHRRMYFIGATMTKVAAMFQLLPDDTVPAEASQAFVLILAGLESGNPSDYARCDATAMALYNEWLAARGVH